MRILKKGDPEYIDNGHYKHGGIEYMSIWTYKNNKGLGDNSNSKNGFDARDMNARYQAAQCEPDFGDFGTVFIYNLEDLEDYYKNR
jgi:hypothetical protein